MFTGESFTQIIFLFSQLRMMDNPFYSPILSKTASQQGLQTKTNTSLTKRIMRKPNERALMNRSFSRTSSERSNSQLNINPCFIKITPFKSAVDNPSKTGTHVGILQRIGDTNQRKRHPTPTVGYRVKQKEQPKEDKDKELMLEIELGELQKELAEEKRKNEILQKRIGIFQKEIKTKVKKIQQLQANIAQSKKESSPAHQLRLLSVNSPEENKDPSESIDSISKAHRNTLKQITSQFQSKIGQLQQEKSSLKQQYEQILNSKTELLSLYENSRKSVSKVQIPKKQKSVKKLSRDSTPEHLKSLQSDRQMILENMLLIKDIQIGKLNATISKLEINLNFVNRKKNDEIQIIKNKKTEEIKAVREKLSSSSRQCNFLKSELQQLRISTIHAHKNRIKRCSQEPVEFSLSP